MINIWPFRKKQKPTKYRLNPNAYGSYSLERWFNDRGYSMIVVKVTPEEADKCIANLEREAIYYREEGK